MRREIRREQARRGLLPFTNYTHPNYTADPMHVCLAEALDAVVQGEITKLMVFAPPQHGKSELTSRRLPAYWLGRRPDDPVILTSYAGALAVRHSRDARAIVEGPEFADLFPDITTDPASRAVDYWRIAGRRGYLLASGVAGPMTGSGAALGIIDDPFANWAEAHSPVARDRVYDWYRGAFRTRVWERGAIILVMTRWHEDDLAGRLLRNRASGRYPHPGPGRARRAGGTIASWAYR